MGVFSGPMTVKDASCILYLDSINQNSYKEVVNGNLIANGTFDSDTVWTKGTGWTISGGTANFAATGSYSNLYQLVCTIGKAYKMTVTAGVSSGVVYIKCGNNGNNIGITTSGTYNLLSICSGDTGAIIQANTTFNGYIDNVIVEEISSTWNDLSIYGNNGILFNGIINNYNDSSIIFDGVSDYITVTGLTNYNFGSAITVIAYHKNIGGDYRGIISNIYGNGSRQGFDLRYGREDYFGGANNGTNLNCIIKTSNGYYNLFINAELNVWGCYAFTYDGVNFITYKNGYIFGISGVTGILGTNTYPVTIGRNSAGNEYLSGNLAYTMLYNRALSASEILQNYNASKNRYKFNATGGIITIVNNYKIHTFISSDTFIPNQAGNVEVLVVGGGGGGGYGRGGGGGAGGLIYNNKYFLTGSTPVTIGFGGSGGTAYYTTAQNGGNSVFGRLTCIGGGGGAGAWANVWNGASGGSGGGGSGNSPSPGYAGSGGTYTLGQGYVGGRAYSDNMTYTAAGGGGGSGAPGNDAVNNIAGNGGSGLSYNISGILTYYAGGGGAGGDGIAIAGSGGSSIGGNGSKTTVGGNAIPNTGSGGGGGTASQIGGYGGSGIVIVRYQI